MSHVLPLASIILPTPLGKRQRGVGQPWVTLNPGPRNISGNPASNCHIPRIQWKSVLILNPTFGADSPPSNVSSFYRLHKTIQPFHICEYWGLPNATTMRTTWLDSGHYLVNIFCIFDWSMSVVSTLTMNRRLHTRYLAVCIHCDHKYCQLK